ncbi:MAG: 3-deoxy-D-manno-octulosonic-acid transferase [Roseibaca calidilacus]|uniref:3-deoxy-D-manno-octulosonic acid transferase n=1 Tax=Roseibaca calidilacus TaxID=1666912 RepID=A0A0P7W3A4_9RHOB|nr:hypothetical protein [Roseibaca calidilacus]KPP90743.1 MAG: 3-deoxy-D-manno-octulosonic-acid transferase [Roseibaca calidilacus]CUX83485.1 3-deoxy-D-manno-octulosonic-acid transferase [Roseibaca calidilacus]
MTGHVEQTAQYPDLGLIAGLGSPLLWLHCDTPRRLEKLAALSEAVLQADEAVGLVLSFPVGCTPPPEIPRRLCVACQDDGAQLARLLGRGARVATALLATRSLAARLVLRLRRQNTRVLLAEMAAPRVTGLWSVLPGHTRRVLGRVDHVFLARESWQDRWQRAGVPGERMSVIGALAQAPLALKCNEAEREALAESLRQRTVWLAAGVPPEEEEQVIAVQHEALRETHRLALILHPSDPMRGPALYDRFAHQFNMALRSRDDPLLPETQVYIADTEGERGLWYRLAVACYMGGSFSTGSTYSPLEPAGLGCAIVHGPESGRFDAAFDMLTERRASRRVTRSDALGAMMRSVLRPERAAEMAHGGWQVVSEGSEATETLVTALLAANRD